MKHRGKVQGKSFCFQDTKEAKMKKEITFNILPSLSLGVSYCARYA
ncbi:hypothetical protein JYQ62_03435 [Nostoc sp. UHCC 0702]|nr:hypothetical protein JYQ62_03435 [Nostoc sp. UHCC 0702]